jgi:glyoxylase-like metal-dependent hydrolase (beta-lactamase superfamily II)/8-oxo-dGTP pyrophosphatase MutT (NUDIX family)
MSIREAVSLIVTREPDSSEVYLIERSPELRFWGGYFAFPGGTIDQEDFLIPVGEEDETDPENRFIVAATRELFEETGLFLPGKDRERLFSLAESRRQLLAGDVGFSAMLKDLTIKPHDFAYVCTTVTPEFSPVRFHTQFFWVQVPEGQAPVVWNGELVSGRFIKAGEALAKWRAGEMQIVPPVVVMLSEIESCGSLREAVTSIRAIADRYLEGSLHQVCYTPGIQMLTLKSGGIAPGGFTNSFLVGESVLCLVDPAPVLTAEQERLWRYVDQQVERGARLKAILLTHHHPDHVGAVNACCKKYGVEVWASTETAAQLADIRVSRYLEGGDEIELGLSPDGKPGWKLQVIETPGHTRGHLCFIENRYGAIIAGDLVSTISSVVIDPETGSMSNYLHSLDSLAAVCDGTLYPGHGPPARQGRRAIEKLARHRREREDKILSKLTPEFRTIGQLLESCYDDTERELWFLAEKSLRAHLLRLIEIGKCEEENGTFRGLGKN